MRDASIDAIDAARHWKEDHEIDEHREAVDLDWLKALTRERFRLPHELRYGDHRGDRGVLDSDRQQRAERWQHAHERLRQHDAPQDLRARHAERQRSAGLAWPHRFDAGTEDLRGIRGEMDG